MYKVKNRYIFNYSLFLEGVDFNIVISFLKYNLKKYKGEIAL